MTTMHDRLIGASEKARDAWEGFRSSRVRVLILALVLALFFCAVTELAWVKADLNDDYAIATALSGRFDGEQGLCLFLNVILCRVIFFLNVTIPQINWFAALELFNVFISFTIICYVAIRYFRLHLAALTVGLVALFTLPGSFTINNFTYVAFITSCSGCMLLTLSLVKERHDPVDIVAGIFFLSLGSLWRNTMAWLCVPLFGIAALAIALGKRSDTVSAPKALVRLWPFVLAVIIGFGLTVYDLQVWKQSPWQDWRTYNDARSMLSDFPHYSYEDIEDELKELDVSPNDYSLLFAWTTEDPEFFSTDKMVQRTGAAILH